MPGLTAWLDPLCLALDESDIPIDFFFRNDDVGRANDELRALLACFRRHSVPLDLAAIPTALTVEFADEIRAAHAELLNLGGKPPALDEIFPPRVLKKTEAPADTRG